ncbi:TPA: MFS transporter [Streptococcus equi subsp. zooepidemicus]|nr:MFS transporter [Streptococcus equi subsp. zooepidemicus]
MRKNDYQLLASRAINKIGNTVYDYGNSSWIAGLGATGRQYLGYYQLAEGLISLILNPIGGAIADRYKRRQLLLWTDAIGAISCGLLALIANPTIMLYGLITVNALLAISYAFSGTAFRAYVVTLVETERLVHFNAQLEIVSQIISISSPMLAFLVMDCFGIKTALALDSISFLLSFLCLYTIKDKERHITKQSSQGNRLQLLTDIKEGLQFIYHDNDMFSLLIIASLVNFFIAAFNYLIPFSNQLLGSQSSYASLLSMGALGAILGAFMANKLFKNNQQSLLLSLGLSGLGLLLITAMALLKLPVIVIVLGNLWFECFLTIFNIHFFSIVQKKVPEALLGRVFSSIVTTAILLMPLATTIMTCIPASVHLATFAVIGIGIMATASLAYYCNYRQSSKKKPFI